MLEFVDQHISNDDPIQGLSQYTHCKTWTKTQGRRKNPKKWINECNVLRNQYNVTWISKYPPASTNKQTNTMAVLKPNIQ